MERRLSGRAPGTREPAGAPLLRPSRICQSRHPGNADGCSCTRQNFVGADHGSVVQTWSCLKTSLLQNLQKDVFIPAGVLAYRRHALRRLVQYARCEERTWIRCGHCCTSFFLVGCLTQDRTGEHTSARERATICGPPSRAAPR